MRFRRAAALTAALALSLPAGALAQSGGDDQYRDPFGEEAPQQDPGGGDTGDTAQPAPDTSGQSAPAPAPVPAPAPAPAPAPTTGTEPTATVAGELPRTGLAAVLTAVAGLVMLAGGFALRRAART